MPSIPVGLTRSAHDLRGTGFIDTEGHSSKFIQVSSNLMSELAMVFESIYEEYAL